MTDSTRERRTEASQRPRGLRAADRRPGASFLLAAAGDRRGEATGGQAVSLLLLEISQVLLAGARLGAQRRLHARRGVPARRRARPRPRRAAAAAGRDARGASTPTRFVFDPYAARGRREPRSPTTSPASRPTSPTACATTGPATSARRCGGGSSPTSPPGATSPARRCDALRRWSPTTGSTPSSRASGAGRRRPMQMLDSGGRPLTRSVDSARSPAASAARVRRGPSTRGAKSRGHCRAEVRRLLGRRRRRRSSGSPQRIVEAKQAGHDVVVVVSAMGDTTDDLLDLAEERQPAAAGPRAGHAAHRRRADLDGAGRDGHPRPRLHRPLASPARRPA